MDFGEITEVCPWDVLAYDCGQDLDADQVAEPRVFKSHESWADVPKGARYIYVARNPLDAFVSFHKFLPTFAGLRAGDISQRSFADAIFAGASESGQIWNHYLGWWERRDDPRVLWVFFEDMKKDLRAEIKRVAAFLELPLDAALLDEVAEKSSYRFMSAPENAHHYDDHFVRSKVLPQMGMPADAPQHTSKVRKGGGKVGGRSEIPADVLERLRNKWDAVLTGPTGCATYDELKRSVAAEAKGADETTTSRVQKDTRSVEEP